MENFTNEQILLRYPACLRDNIQELWMYEQIGISGMHPQINLPPSKLDFDYNTDMGNTFTLNIPYAGRHLQWEVIFNDEDPTFAPDFDILNDTFLTDPTIDTISKHLPSLANWDVKNSKCLVNVIREMIVLYKKEQLERLRNEPKYLDILEGYDRIKDKLKLSDDHIEMFVENNQLNIMILLKLDFSNLPVYIQETYFGDSALLLNPGVDMALLKISFLKNRITSYLQVSPRLEKVFSDYMMLHIPPYTKNDDLVQYIQLIYHLVEEKINQINEQFKLKEEFFSILLSLHGLKVLEYDNTQFSKGLFLFEIEGFSFIVHILIGNKFPQEKPTLILKSIYMKNASGEPHSLKTKEYPYNSQLKPEEMVNRMMKYIEEIAPKFKDYIQL
ncbi:brisc and brca1-a complex member 2 [Holotrichia oblita]|uniref:Brisc and brca1-a complex member 2 n=1 Tax=Holotrichia oblita TaxID=644536 RepID=A0ACB9SWY9_HOLOL|nr:brisc and brca1-a complex member 2 [Holotrichia oblita]